jgi:DNA-binding GntR family transcriptional regulator
MATDSPATIGLARPEHTTLTRATADALQNAIYSGVFPFGSQLPSEAELMEQLGVSRTTLREAIKSLEELGLIYRRRGLGTFVSERSIVKDLSLNFGITTMISQAGLKPGTIDQEIRLENAAPEAAKALELAEGGQVLVVDRVRTANGRPSVWTLDYFDAARFDIQRLRASLAGGQSVYTMLREEFQLSVGRGVATLAPAAASATTAAKLQVKRGTPMMLITQTDYSSNDQPILYSVEVHLPDLFVFTIHRKGPHL